MHLINQYKCIFKLKQEVKTIIKDNGFLVIQSKVTKFSQEEAEKFYEEHKGQKLKLQLLCNSAVYVVL